jgi:hypothetical protein
MRVTGAARTPVKNTSVRAKKAKGKNGSQLIVAANWTTVVLHVIHAQTQNTAARRIGAKSLVSTAYDERSGNIRPTESKGDVERQRFIHKR